MFTNSSQKAGRKKHAGTRHYAVLPLSFAVGPLKCEEDARHNLLPCPDCQIWPKILRNTGGGKSMSNWLQTITVYHNIYFQFELLFVPPKFAWKSQISQLYELIARWQRKRMSPPGDQNMHRVQLPRKERKRKTNQWNIETGPQWLCENRCSIFVITHTRFRLDGIELQWAIIQSHAWFRGYDYSAYCYVNFDCISG